MIEINKGEDNTFQFSLKSAEGQTLLQSIDFDSEAEIKRTVSGLKPLALKAHSIERKTNYEGYFLFNLKDENGKIIGNSSLYDSEAGMENGISNFRRRVNSISKLL